MAVTRNATGHSRPRIIEQISAAVPSRRRASTSGAGTKRKGRMMTKEKNEAAAAPTAKSSGRRISKRVPQLKGEEGVRLRNTNGATTALESKPHAGVKRKVKNAVEGIVEKVDGRKRVEKVH